MDSYLTPERYRTMGFGTDDVEDVPLAAKIAAASRKVDRYCNVPAHPSRYSFLGGKVVGEPHTLDVNQEGVRRRVWLNSTPLTGVEKLEAFVTNTQKISFGPNELFVTRDWVEIISLAMTASGLFGALMIPNLGLGSPLLRATYSYGYEYSSADESFQPTDALTYRGQNQFWSDADVEVKVGGETVEDGFTIDRVEGTIEFAEQPAGDVRASYGYKMPDEIGLATGMIVARDLSRADLVKRGMGELQSLHMGEGEMSRLRPTRAMASSKEGHFDIPDEAADLLDAFVFITVR